MAWTRFMDMHSGGGDKLGFEDIWIEAAEDEAVDIFEEVFDRDPYNVTCQCCGPDFSYWEEEKPEIKNGDAVVSADDIRKLRSPLEHKQ